MVTFCVRFLIYNHNNYVDRECKRRSFVARDNQSTEIDLNPDIEGFFSSPLRDFLWNSRKKQRGHFEARKRHNNLQARVWQLICQSGTVEVAAPEFAGAIQAVQDRTETRINIRAEKARVRLEKAEGKYGKYRKEIVESLSEAGITKNTKALASKVRLYLQQQRETSLLTGTEAGERRSKRIEKILNTKFIECTDLSKKFLTNDFK